MTSGSRHVLETRPVTPAVVPELARLFASERTTNRCWCTAFCGSRRRFALDWVTGGGRQRFEALASAGPEPMGVLASLGGEPVGWAACGPRTRYTAAIDGRSRLLRTRDRAEDATVWLLPCLFVAREHRGQGVTRELVRAAVTLARGEGAAALEAWPTTGSDPKPADAFLGRERVFADLGFTCAARPAPGRAIMRLDLGS